MAPVRVETLHESERARVYRLFLPDRTVVLKQPLGPDAEKRLRHAGLATAVAPVVLAPEGIVTVSIGVAAMVPTPDSFAENLVEIADIELDRAKTQWPQPGAGGADQHGGNRMRTALSGSGAEL